VEQSAGLMSGTIRENIKYGREGATEREIERAATAAAAHEFISALPSGYDTQVGERGSLLSGGQQTRLALARAMVKDPALLLLDEATSSLDAENESAVIRALERFAEGAGAGSDKGNGKLVVAFTHSEQLMKAASLVFVMHEGRITHSGTFQDLKKKGVLY
jgi:ABC-type multidrug transport system fused ATPase/permease subunit